VDIDVSTILVPMSTPIVEALRVLDESAGKIVLVVRENDVLAGVLTDGDVRRHILAGRDLGDPVAEAMNPDPVWVAQGTPTNTCANCCYLGRSSAYPFSTKPVAWSMRCGGLMSLARRECRGA